MKRAPFMQTRNVENQNYQAFKYQESINERFVLLCEPLAEYLNTLIFGYMRIYYNGQYLGLNNKLDYQREYFQNVHSNSLTWGE